MMRFLDDYDEPDDTDETLEQVCAFCLDPELSDTTRNTPLACVHCERRIEYGNCDGCGHNEVLRRASAFRTDRRRLCAPCFRHAFHIRAPRRLVGVEP